MALIQGVVNENRESKIDSKAHLKEKQEDPKSLDEILNGDKTPEKSEVDEDSALTNKMPFNSVQQLTTVQINRIIQSLKQGQEQKQRIDQTILQDKQQQEQFQKHQNPKIIPFRVGTVEKERREYSLFFREDLEMRPQYDSY